MQERFQRGVRDEIRELSARVQRNNRRAMLEVRAVLTEQQRASLRRFLDESSAPAGAGTESDLLAPDR